MKNANLRAGPSTGTARLATLAEGTRVEVVETVGGGQWHRVAAGGRARGFVFAPLLAPAAE
ncbi:MAG: SH3 domain-containing protein [Rhodospirillales bacterium]